MKIITLRPFRGDEGFVNARTHLDVDPRRAKTLVNKGLAVYETGAVTEDEAARQPRNKMLAPSKPARGAPVAAAEAVDAGEAAAAAVADPTASPRRGSRTGGARSRSSSRRGRQRKE